MSISIGIDLGTTYACVATCQQGGHVVVIPNEEGSRTTPSFVAFTENERLIGDQAKAQAGTNPRNTIFGAKRLIGRNYNDKSMNENLEQLPFEVVNDNNNPKIRVEFKGEHRMFRPEEISAMLLTRMKETAERYFGKTVTEAVITVPAYFNDAQRQATKDAGVIAGLNVMRIINEPTAAAIAYGFHKKINSRNILVFDLGGGTFDVSILSIDEGIYEVKATSGDTRLGGEDFDNRMVVHCINEIKNKYSKDISNDRRARSRLKCACEVAKRSLSTHPEASIDIENLLQDFNFKMKISLARFEEINNELFEKTLEPVKLALTDAKMEPSDINDVVLVGGSTRIPKVQEILLKFFDRTKLNKDINPDEAVAWGAAVQAAKLVGDEHEALQEMILLDVTPLSLGIETRGGVMSFVVNRNTTVPVTKTKTFTTHKDMQTTVRIQVFEGERPLTKQNNMLGNFKLEGIAAAPLGVPEIEVTFNVDSNGILNVSALEKKGGKGTNITISNDGRLSKSDIEEMIKKAQQLQLEDEKEKQRVQSRLNLESYCLKMQSVFRSAEAKSKIEEPKREIVFKKCTETLSWIDSCYNASKDEFDKKYRETHNLIDGIRQLMFQPQEACGEEDILEKLTL